MNVFRREGEYWAIVYDHVTCHLRDTRGLQILAVLLGRPGERMRAGDLVVAVDGACGPATKAQERARVRATRAIRAALRKLDVQLPALGHHLAATVRNGHHCVYLPDPRAAIAWETGQQRENLSTTEEC